MQGKQGSLQRLELSFLGFDCVTSTCVYQLRRLKTSPAAVFPASCLLFFWPSRQGKRPVHGISGRNGGFLQTDHRFANRIGVHGEKGKRDGICEKPSRAVRDRRGAKNEGCLQPKSTLNVEACEGCLRRLMQVRILRHAFGDCCC